MVLTKTTLNVALTRERPWLGCKMEKHQYSHTCLSSHSLFCLQACGLFCICGLSMEHTHYLFLLFLSFLFFDWVSLALGPLQNLLELGICTHSHDAGWSVQCFATLGKPLSKDKVTKGKEVVKEEESAKAKEICVYQSWPALAGVWTGFSREPALAGGWL
jgi:hypothetical protein